MLSYNPYIVVPLAVWAITQLAKFVVAAFQGRVDLKYLYASGGMPSVHSAVVCALATTSFIVDGPQNHLFGVTAILAAIVMYDSFGVRRASGDQAAAINMIVASLADGKVRLQNPALRLREILGHKPAEVSVGAVVGVVLGVLFNANQAGPLWDWLGALPTKPESMVYLVLFALLVVGGIATRVVLAKKYPDSVTMRSLGKAILLKTQVVGWLGLVLALAQYEGIRYFSWRVWTLLVIMALLGWDGWLFSRYRTLPQALAAEKDSARKLKWFQFGKKKKKK